MEAQDEPRPPEGARGLAALLPARGAVRRTAARRPRSSRRARPGELRMGANPHVNGGQLRGPQAPRRSTTTPLDVALPARTNASALTQLGSCLADVFRPTRTSATSASSAPTRSRRTASTRSSRRRPRYEWPCDPEIDTGHSPDGRIMEMLSEHTCQGWLQGYVLTGRHGVFPCYEAFVPIVDGMVNQYAKFLKMSSDEAPWREPVAVAQLPAHVRRLAPGPQRLLAPGAGLHQLHAQPQEGRAPASTSARRQHPAGDDGALPAAHSTRSTSSSPPSSRCRSG